MLLRIFLFSAFAKTHVELDKVQLRTSDGIDVGVVVLNKSESS
jgi:hypothetical protein